MAWETEILTLLSLRGKDILLESIYSYILSIKFWVYVYALGITIVHCITSTKKYVRLWKTRHLRKVWGIKDKDYVIVVCSELDDPGERQYPEPREFIYNLKYGDVDAYFEVVVTLLRLFPNIKLRVMSSGEVESTRVDLDRHLILIGGPDYNKITARILKKENTRYCYRSPYVEERSHVFPEEIVIYDKFNDKEYCETNDENDYGYFERIKNSENPDKIIILIGGCHTIGVTGAVKAFSMADSEHGEIPQVILENAKKVCKKISAKSEFSVLLSVERVGQTINVPKVKVKNIAIRENIR
jgi:hypothetical protein